MAGPTADETGSAASNQQLQKLMQFKQWSIFLPRRVSSQVEYNATYIFSRQNGNPAFFEQTRDRLSSILEDCDVLQMSGKTCTADDGLAKALDVVLQSLITALGFLSNRQFHKALALGALCVQVADRLTEEYPDLIFWRLLCRANLGNAYLQLRRFPQARAVLEEAMTQVEAAPAGNRGIRVIAGAIRSYLARCDLDEDPSSQSALRQADAAIEEFEGHIWELSDTKEDREAMSTVVASAYLFRGECDSAQDRHEVALSWYGRAVKVLGDHQDLGTDGPQIIAVIKEDSERAECLKLKTDEPPKAVLA